MKKHLQRWVGLLTVTLTAASLSATAVKATVRDVHINGRIKGEHFRFDLTCSAEAPVDGAEAVLVRGPIALIAADSSGDWSLRYDAARKAYLLRVGKGRGPVNVKASFAVKTQPLDGKPYWHVASVDLPADTARHLVITGDKEDLEIELPGALEHKYGVREGVAEATGILGPNAPFVVEWKGRMETVEAKLLVASEANTIITVTPGSLQCDAMFSYTVSQGELDGLRFLLPEGLSITQIQGTHVQDWAVESAEGKRTLAVHLNRKQKETYQIRLLGEAPLPPLPTHVQVPVVQPLDGTRADGFLAIGTNSAIQLQMTQSTGLSQMDGAAFPRISLSQDQARALPQSKTFFYSFAATPYQLGMALADIVPSFDADESYVITAKDDDLTIDGTVELEVRDAPVRRLTMTLPAHVVVAGVTGRQIADYGTRPTSLDDTTQELAIEFQQPVMGRAMFQIRLELGKSPLGTIQSLQGMAVSGARSERGFIAVVPDQGVLIEAPQTKNLREIHTRSMPIRVPNAEFAWRFREVGWSLSLPIRERPSAIRAEAFHLLSLGEGVVYGSIALTYAISGAPVDELCFEISPDLQNIEFVGMDVSRWSHEENIWTVKLRRKVLGDYNLGVTFSQRYDDGATVLAGGVACRDVETQTGFITIASHRSLRLAEESADPALIGIGHEETPAHYRLLVSAPILRSYKYVSSPHNLRLQVSAYERGATPSVIVEFVNARTTLSVNDAHNAESVTRVRYTVKNSSAQFLDIRVPEEIKIWSTRQITRVGQGEKASRISAAREGALLKIPLQRERNPNTPFTVEIEYGQVHGKLGWQGEVNLELPSCQVQGTYADWMIKSPQGWIIKPGNQGSMGAPTTTKRSPVSLLWRDIRRGWRRAFASSTVGITLVILGILIVGVIVFPRRWTFAPVTAILILFLLVQGVRALSFSGMHPWVPSGNEVTFNQILDLSTDAPLTVQIHAVPDWRAGMSLPTTVGLGLLAVAAAFLTAYRRKDLRKGIALALTAAVLAGLQFPLGRVIALHLFTWGIAVILVSAIALRPIVNAVKAGLRRRIAFAIAASLCLFSISGKSQTLKEVTVPPLTVAGKQTSVALAVTEDSVKAVLNLAFDTASGVIVPIAAADAVILTPPKAPGCTLTTEVNQLVLAVSKGAHEINLELLFPLARATDDQSRSFQIPLVPSLATDITFEIPRKDLDVQIEGAISLTSEEKQETTCVTAILPPTQYLKATWKPRGRRTQLEETRFYADLVGALRADSGLTESAFLLDLRVAQGELTRIDVAVPEEMTVTRVSGSNLSSWRFDPATKRLNIGFAQPVMTECQLAISGQVVANTMPYTVTVGVPEVDGALRQQTAIGILSSPSVMASATADCQPMNIDDYRRVGSALLKTKEQAWGGDVLYAYRFPDAMQTVDITAAEVKPEIRTQENATFSIGSERLVYNTALNLEISKAGVFSVDLAIPDGFDIDDLTSPEISHWDETEDNGQRIARAHFLRKLQGTATINVALSKAVVELPDTVDTPRISIRNVIKHRGQLIISVERGVRVSIAGRDGVSELDVAALGLRDKPALAVKLLRPLWKLQLRTEALPPRIGAEFLHLAEVTDGLVRHTYYLRLRLQNAGTKIFEIQTPPEALGLTIAGPEIARKELIAPDKGLWRIELTGKWYDRPYPMEINYETRFDRETGDVSIEPIIALHTDMQKGFVAIRTSARVELTGVNVGPTLQRAEARSIPSKFGAGELADAAFCYSTPTPGYELLLKAARHDAADVLRAEVLKTDLVSVISRGQDAIHQVKLILRAGDKRHLKAILPPGAVIWSLLVDRQSRTPSFAENAGRRVLQIPIPQSTEGELNVDVDLIYVIAAENRNPLGKHTYEGPKFDLPLRNISWQFYVPPEFDYEAFAGTLSVDEEEAWRGSVSQYSISTYEAETSRANTADLQKAVKLQQQGLILAKKGNQKAARQALSQAYNYSVADSALNEDARVNLRNLLQQQAVVGLVGRREDVRQSDQPQQRGQMKIGATFTQEEAERLQNSLSKADSDNLGKITSRMIEIQEAAAGMTLQLTINPPLHGRQILFKRDMQVEPNADMTVMFSAVKKPPEGRSSTLLFTVATFVLLLILLGAPARIVRKWNSLPKTTWKRQPRRPNPPRRKARVAEQEKAVPEAAETSDAEKNLEDSEPEPPPPLPRTCSEKPGAGPPPGEPDTSPPNGDSQPAKATDSEPSQGGEE